MASGRTKHVLSKRLGISYNETFHAHDANSGMKLGNKHIRIFNKTKLQPGATHKLADKLSIAKKYLFLFLGSQYVHKPIKYLKYKQARVAPNANDYRFSILDFIEKHERQLISCGNKLTTVIPVESPIPISPIHTVAPFNPITDMFISH
ncbi:unnamed protein product [Rhizophagus irregularis]|nr:unnamed protein product [Rhizophagus irregularis]